VVLSPHLPRRASEGAAALRAAGPDVVFDAVGLLDDDDLDRLRRYAKGGARAHPLPGFWTPAELHV
jgi:hypothetical protein